MLATIFSGAAFGFLGSIFKGIMGHFKAKQDRKHEIDLMREHRKTIQAETEASVKITETQVKGAIEITDAEAYKLSQTTGHQDITKESWINRLLEYKKDRWWSFIPAAFGTILVFLMGLVDILRRLMRPVLTAYVMVAATWVTTIVWEILKKDADLNGVPVLTPQQAYALFLQIIDFTFFMASSGFGWWFGDRTVTKGLFKKYGENT